MQYLLTKKEYEEMQATFTDKENYLKGIINELCKEVAIYKPITVSGDGQEEESPWGCIHSKIKQVEYCDDCPVNSYCTIDKNYSK